MGAAFTPGPWSVGPSHVVAQRVTNREGQRTTRFVAEAILSAPFAEGERDANARLIAAAPELYDIALRAAGTFRAYAALHGAKLTPKGDQKAGKNNAMADELEAVLAKARGDAK